MTVRKYFYFILIIVLLQLCATLAVAQAPAQTTPPATAGILRGQVTDPSGAAIASANVVFYSGRSVDSDQNTNQRTGPV